MFATKIIDLGREREIVGYYPDALVKKVEGQLGESKDAYKHERSQEFKDQDNRERATRRAKTKIRRLAKRYNMQYMWTLTFAKQITTIYNSKNKKTYTYDVSTWEGAWHLFKLFIARCRKSGLKFDYIATAEIQEKRLENYGEKVYHFHMATNMYIPQNKVMQLKYNRSHKKPINHSLLDFWTFGHTKATEKKSNRFCSNYMVKYISKAFEELDIKAKQRYHVSEGMVIPVTKIEFASHKEMIAWCLKENMPILDKKGLPVNKYFILGDSLEVWWFLLEGGSC